MKSGFSLTSNHEAQLYISHIIQETTEEILQKVAKDNCVAIILTGSFGRGEGGIRSKNNGWEIINDIELLVIQPNPMPEQLRELGIRLAKKFGIYKIDIESRKPSNLQSSNFTMFAYDERYGSQVLYGDPVILGSMGEFDPQDMPLWEGARLLLNRGGGLIMHFTWPRYLAQAELSDETRQYMKNQLVKAGVALGDALIVCHRRYHTLYRKRWDIFRELVSEQKIQLDSNAIALINNSYEEKLFPDTHSFFIDLFASYERLLQAYYPVFGQVMASHFQAPITTEYDYLKLMTGKTKQRLLIESTILWYALRTTRRVVREMRWPDRHDWFGKQTVPPQAVYAAIPFVLLSAPFLSNPQHKTLWIAEALLGIQNRPSMWVLPFEERWEYARSVCFDRWYLDF